MGNSKLRTSLIASVSIGQLFVATYVQASWKFVRLGDVPGGTFQTTSAYDVSDDGSAVVGLGETAANFKAWRWTQSGGHVQIENSNLYSHSSAISADGSVAVGWIRNQLTGQVEALRWTEATGAVGLGDLAGGLFQSFANDVSADGTVVIGLGHNSSGQFATRWTEATGQTSIGDLPGGIAQSAAFGVSRDGLTIVGTGHSAAGPEAFSWTNAGGMVGLNDLDGGIFESHAEDVLGNGNVVIGYGHSALGREAFRWTHEGGMVGLGDLSGGTYDSWAWGGSADGSLIVGSASTVLGSEAFLWDQLKGMRNLRIVAESEYGLDLTGWTLTRAFAMSPDGRIIVGEGINPDGNAEAWMIRPVPEPTSLLILLSAVFGVVLTRW